MIVADIATIVADIATVSQPQTIAPLEKTPELASRIHT
jgi:hypothetical protein